MKILSRSEVDTILAPLGMKIGQWNELSAIESDSQTAWIRQKAPTVANELYVASLWLMDWLPQGNWKLIQIDNSTSPSRDESLLFQRLMNSSMKEWDVATQRTFVFDFDDDIATRQRFDIVISSVIFLALMSQWHIHIVSSGCSRGQRLALQDGDIYFYGNEESISAAKAVVEQTQLHPLTTPQWVAHD